MSSDQNQVSGNDTGARSVERRRVSEFWLLASLVVVLIAVRATTEYFRSEFMPSEGRSEPRWVLTVWFALTVIGSAAATRLGMRYFSKVSSLACGLCVGLLTGLWRSLLLSADLLGDSAALALIVAALTVSRWLRPLATLALHAVAVGLLGYWGIGWARRAMIDVDLALGALVALGCVVSQSLLIYHCWRRVAAREDQVPWGSRIVRVLTIPLWIVLLLGGWALGWRGEMERRIREFESRGGAVWIDRLPFSLDVAWLTDWLRGGHRSHVILMADAGPAEIRTLGQLPRLDEIRLLGSVSPELHRTLAGLPSMTTLWFGGDGQDIPSDLFDDVKAPKYLVCPLTSVELARALSRSAVTTLLSTECRLPPEALAELVSSPKLQQLTLAESRLTDEDLRAFAGSPLPALHIQGPTGIRGEGLSHLCSMPNLWSLRVDHPIDIEGVRAVGAMPAPSIAIIRVEELSDEMIDVLKNRTGVTLTVDRIDSARLSAARASMPNVQLLYWGR